ncbi:hypothetical protein NX059_011283 [Plenodomus lindquistii]|nr:hypothetical protein NX059_011283 [Plenodomus lindquistii]
MTTPSPRPSDLALSNTGPSSSFLKQLLNQIKGQDDTAPPQRHVYQRSTPVLRPRPHGSRKRRTSVWVGGASIARDVRDKLRVADEARFPSVSPQGTDGTPLLGPTPRLVSPQSLTSSSSPGSCVLGTTRSESNLKQSREKATPKSILLGSTSKAAPHSPRPDLTGLRIPSAQFLVPPNCNIDAPNSPVSPLMFCDIDSDISLTPSDTEPPTSAATEDSTQASTWSADHAPNSFPSRSISPGKRGLETQEQPRMLTKKMRTSTLPEAKSNPFGSRTSRRLGDDNRRLIRNVEFIERSAALPASISPDESVILPELSSFRPEATPTTPVRPAMRRSSMPHKSPSRSPETPSWARSLHLIDTDVSIYKGQSDPWRENLLCLNCFSRHGKFSKMLIHGYETCGGDQVLDSHYWEPAA